MSDYNVIVVGPPPPDEIFGAGRDPYGISGELPDNYEGREVQGLNLTKPSYELANFEPVPETKSAWETFKRWVTKAWEWIKENLSMTAIPGGWELMVGGAKIRYVKKPKQMPELTVGNSGNLFPLVLMAGAALVLFLALR